MWKHKNFINLQLYAQGGMQVNFDSNITKVTFTSDDYSKSITTSGDSVSTGTLAGSFVVELTSGYVLDSVTVNFGTITNQTENSFDFLDDGGSTYVVFTITSKQSASTPTFKHFYDAGLQGTGTIKFRHYSQSEPSTGETWVLNETINVSTDFSYDINFESNNESYITIESLKDGFVRALKYNYKDSSSGVTTAYTDDDGYVSWSNQAYRTITFETAPTGDLLTWLQANGTKQGQVTGHTLAFTGVTVTVDGVAVTSPYTLTQNCTIVASSDIGVSVNGDTSIDTPTMTLSDTDIVLAENRNAVLSEVTINYTVGGGSN